jgi:hypothetical protein
MNNCVFDGDTKCSALKEKRCEGCRFRKTNEELIEGREKAKARLKTLPEKMQERIHYKYHSQRRPRLLEL